MLETIAIDCIMFVVTLSRIVACNIWRLDRVLAMLEELVLIFGVFVTNLPEFSANPLELMAMLATFDTILAELVVIFAMFWLMAAVTDVKSVVPPPPLPPPAAIAALLLTMLSLLISIL